MSVFTNPASSSVDQAKAYTAAVLDLLGTRDPMEVLEHTPSALEQAIGGLSRQQTNAHEAPGKRIAAFIDPPSNQRRGS